LLLASAELGKQVAALLDTETPYGGAVAALFSAPKSPVGTRALQAIAAFTFPPGMQLDETKHFAVNAGWGHAGKGGVTTPGKGKIIECDYTAQNAKPLQVQGRHEEWEPGKLFRPWAHAPAIFT
jgi:hypothetical protein